jgi:hypothetical protein
LRENGLIAIHFLKRGILKEAFLILYQPEKFPGHIKVLGGPHVAHGPDVAQA